MKRVMVLIILALGFSSVVKAQDYDTVSIKDIQKISQTDLSNCEDKSSYMGDTVVVAGTVVMNGNLSRIMGAESRNVWIQNGKGPWSGIDVFGFTNPTSKVDIQSLLAGDSVLITGRIEEYQGETEIVPLTGNNVESVHLIGSGQPVQNKTITVNQLNDQNQNNKLPSGEKWEGSFVTIKNVTVVSIDRFGNGRVSFDIKGPNGGRMNVSDQFLAQRTPQNDTAGSFEAPTVGTAIDSIKGVITHSENGCTNANGRGYELNPFDSSHYNYGPAPPRIANLDVQPIAPSSNQKARVKATVTDRNGVDKVWLYYAAGLNNSNFQKVTMNNTSGKKYLGVIPAQQNVKWVKYYVKARDKDNPQMTNTIPNVPNGTKPKIYKIKDGALSIYDIQYAPTLGSNFSQEDASPFEGDTVTVTGTVTSTIKNIHAVFIQQKGKSSYAGIQLTKNSKLNTLNIGNKIEVTGEVVENFGLTVLDNVSNITVKSKGDTKAVEVNPSWFTSNQPNKKNEPYEGMLVNLTSDTSKLYVVDTNPDAPSNYAEYRVGTDTFAPNSGTRVLSGRNTDDVFSSDTVSYINSPQWASQAGEVEVKTKPVSKGEYMDSLKGILIYSFSNYKLLPRTNNDFYNYSDSIVISESSVPENFQLLNVYPNPSSGKIRIATNNTNFSETFKVQVISMGGAVVYHNSDLRINKGQTLNLEHLDRGTYLIRAMNKQTEKVYQNKIVIK